MSETLAFPPTPRRAWPYDRREAKTLLLQATPIAMLALVNMAMSVTDTVMAAAHGTGALAAVAVGSDFYSIVFYLVAGTIGGLAPLYAAASEAGDEERLKGLRSAGWAVVALVAALAASLVWHAPSYLGHLGLDPELLAHGAGYTRAMALTLIPMAVTATLRCRLTAIERPGLLLRVTIAAVPLNALGNQILMNGFGGWAGYGITGAGLSSLLVSSFTALALLVLGRRAGDFGAAPRIERGTVAEVLRIGLPIGLATLAEVGIFLSATLYAATLGAEAAAAHAVAIRTAGVSYIVSIGLLQATTVRMARSRDHRVTIATAMSVSAGAGAALCSLLLVAAALMTGGADGVDLGLRPALEAAAPLVALLAASEFLGPANAAAAGLLRGCRDTRAAMLFSVFGNWCVAAPVAIALASGLAWGATGIWIGLTAGSLTASLLTIGRVPRLWPAPAI
ncbi:MAG: MATE family efflux transporter [Paracoccaceae bacterium]